MIPNMLLCSFRPDNSRKKKPHYPSKLEGSARNGVDMRCPVAVKSSKSNRFPLDEEFGFTNQYNISDRNSVAENGEDRVKRRNGRNKASGFSGLIHRVASSCILNPLLGGWRSRHATSDFSESDEECDPDDAGGGEKDVALGLGLLGNVMGEVSEVVVAINKACLKLQDAQCALEPDKVRAADMAVETELKRLGFLILRERYKRKGRRSGAKKSSFDGECTMAEGTKIRMEVEMVKRKLIAAFVGSSYRKQFTIRTQPVSKVSYCYGHVVASPLPELFEATMRQVREASNSFASLLFSLMRSSGWDISAVVRSITANRNATVSTVHARYAIDSYVSQKIFQGFDHETFNMDDGVSSMLRTDQHRLYCFSRYQDMKPFDPMDLLDASPDSEFSKFCSVKYLSIVHCKMEKSFFGTLEQQRQVMAGKHPRTEFYREFLELAKAVWLLHLLAFALDPPPSLFEATRGAEFHPWFMESVVNWVGGQAPVGHNIVGFPIGPGFKFRNGPVVKARVYLVSRSSMD